MAKSLETRAGNSGSWKDKAKTGATLALGLAAGNLARRTLIEARKHRRTVKAMDGLPAITERVTEYYEKTQGYLTGPLQGRCHYGFTEAGSTFNLPDALHGMEVQLGQAIGLEPGATVVDAGAGFGRVATTMAKEFGYNVLGFDLVPQRVEEANRYAAEHGVGDRVRVQQGDYSHLPLPDNSVDAIYTTETLCHAPDLDAALAEFRRVLKPGGKLVNFEYSIPPHESLGIIRRKISERVEENTGMASIRRFAHGAFPSIMESAGLDQVNVRDITENVIPTWKHLFTTALKKYRTNLIPMILGGTIMDYPNDSGSLMVYPYRNHLKYNIVTSNKPAEA